MKHWKKTVLVVFGLLVAGYINCDPYPFHGPNIRGGHVVSDTVIGNPMTNSMKVVSKACEIMMRAHPELTAAQCQNGVLSTSFSSGLGVPSKILNPFWTLTDAELAGAVSADLNQLDSCLQAIGQLDPNSPSVQQAYNPDLFNSFAGVIQMIPGGNTGCPLVYANNAFSTPTPTPTPPPGVVIVDFDNPRPPPNLGSIYQGIDFTTGGINWDQPYDADTTNFGYNGMSQADDLSFSFSGGPKLLLNLKVFLASAAGTVTVYDDLGQTVSQPVPQDRLMHLVTTGFSVPSNRIYIHTDGSHLGIDDITYKLPDTPPAIAQVQSERGGGTIGRSFSKAFNTDNTLGNLIVVQVNWAAGAALSSIHDSAGNAYLPALPAATGLNGNVQQIWYAKNIKAGPNTVTVNLSSSVYGDISVHEYSGVDKVSPVDQVSSAAGFGSYAASGLVVTHYPKELVFGAINMDSHNLGAVGPGFVLRTTTYGGNIAEDMVVSQTGSYNATADIGWDGRWIAQIVTFKAAP